jgi:cyclohexanone monooxygenase
VTGTEWDEESGRWIVTTNRQDRIQARYVVHSNGPLNRPKLPAMKGINDYKGHTFHTSRWDYDYTGGSSSGNLTGLKGKKVAVVGTGATAVQCVPHLGETAEHLYVFQRTPSSIDLRNNTKTNTEWALNLKPGWHEKRRNNFESLLAGVYQKEDLVNDGWTDLFRIFFGAFRKIGPSNYKMATWAVSSVFSSDLYRLGFEGYNRNKFMNFVGHDNLMKEMEMADFEKMEKIRARADAVIEDPKTAESLKPYYRQLCKRPCFHDEYLQTFNKPNVTLVDTKGRGVNRITKKGIMFEGKEHEVDCIIFATGFEVGTAYTRRSGYEIYGKERQSLTEKWKDGLSVKDCLSFP